MKKNIKLATVQHACTQNLDTNLQTSMQAIANAAKQGADIVLLQELHRSLYFCQQEDTNNFDLAETIPGPSTQHLAQCAKENAIVVVASLFEKRAPGLYHNTAVVFDKDGGLAGKYRKMHIPDDPGYYEKFYFTPGDLGFTPIQTSVATLGVLVCWDQWYPEAARLMALAGAQILLIPTAIGWDQRDEAAQQQQQRDAWITIQRAHAIANGIPIAVSNRIGFEADPNDETRGIMFWGSSFIAGPQGELLADSPTDCEAVSLANIDLTHSEHIRRIWPYLRDRRIDAYADITKRYRDD